ncbi:S-layer homology domain-containing protein [Cohnella silvisoli]|uniref:S-layer homology domain-containing protein n=1 Tax=Cohnella silvisoli TaxID=2873699 RepID=A0ABV1KLV5_9BACL|nr:S-layer homology domain-containing protein [Cohnella silvisoli]MCD9020590.1 S-layer homology domain-containing protein [Cohnella silvisoli]
MKRKLILLSFITALLVSFVLTINPWQATAASSGTDSGLPVRTAQEVAAQWKKLMKTTADYSHPFITEPAISKPYTPGSLRADYIQDGVNAVNFYRFLSGLPDDVASTAALNLQAQYGSVLLASFGRLSHHPSPQPADMPKDFYDKGYKSTSQANIYSSYGFDDHIAARSIDAYMEDSDTDNLDLVGHRRWILNPPLKNVGIGLAVGVEDWKYSALQVFDKSRTEKIDYEYIAYPAQGAFPIEVFKSGYAWSVSINPEKYAKPALKQVNVSVKRIRDNKTWNLSSKNNQVTEKGAYFNVDNNYYGTGPAIIFRPDGVDEYRAGDRFEVTVSGLKSMGGTDKTISYTVDFMSAEKYAPSANEQASDTVTHFTDISKSWAKTSIEWAVSKQIVSDVDGPFNPTNSVTEAEFLKMFISAFGGEVAPAKTGENWSVRYYDYASENGYNLQGSQDSSARTKPISRLSVAEIITSAAGLPNSGDSAIQYLLDNGYSKGKTSATVVGYEGAAGLSRAEAVQFIKNLTELNYST